MDAINSQLTGLTSKTFSDPNIQRKLPPSVVTFGEMLVRSEKDFSHIHLDNINSPLRGLLSNECVGKDKDKSISFSIILSSRLYPAQRKFLYLFIYLCESWAGPWERIKRKKDVVFVTTGAVSEAMKLWPRKFLYFLSLCESGHNF